MAVKYDEIYKQEYTKNLGTSVTDLEARQKAAEEALTKNKDIALGKLKQAYNTNANTLADNKNTALRQAYITKMKEQRALPQNLARQGLGGGVAETTNASIARNYMNNRNDAEKNYATNDTNLKNQYQNDVGTIMSDYNTNLVNLKSSYASLIDNAKQNAISLALSSAAQRYNALQAEEAEAAQQAALASSVGGGTSGGTGDKTNNAFQPPFMEKRSDTSYKDLNKIAHARQSGVQANWNSGGYHYVKYNNGYVSKTKI